MKKNTIRRKSYIEIGNIYFVTCTINQWKLLLYKDDFKNIIIESMDWLCQKKKWQVFAFVIMPNHIHFIVRNLDLNGKEIPHKSFLKLTAHQFKKKLVNENKTLLQEFEVDAVNKKYEFWKRDSLAVNLFNKYMAYQKLHYIHLNPIREKWRLAVDPSDYLYSSASLYEKDYSPFLFLSDLRNEY
jgi:putative transposase